MSDAKMRGPEGCAPECSHAGQTFTADKRGVFTVPVGAVELLKRHGFTVVGEAAPAPAPESDAS
jgi:hypothetical protein